ncbi:MAG: hypothetical protein RLZZ488_1196 [Pseudomonadota bacterium]|jgi:hypothetical protein
MKVQFKFPVFCLISTGLLITAAGCAFSQERSETTTRTETCINGICTSQSTRTETVTNGNGSTGGGVGAVSVRVEGAAGTVRINACSETSAPINACDVSGRDVLSPKHLGCTDSGAHAWSCQDSFSSAPPYPVVVCSGSFADSCTRVGSLY